MRGLLSERKHDQLCFPRINAHTLKTPLKLGLVICDGLN